MIEKKIKRKPIAQKAKQIAKLIRDERPDYHYMRTLTQNFYVAAGHLL